MESHILIKISVILLSLVISSQSMAQDNKPAVSTVLCASLMEFNSGDAEYKAGVDVKGKPVVAADISPQVIDAPKEYSFPITVDIAEYMGMDVPEGLIAYSRIGSVTVKTDGTVLFNDKPLDENSTTALKSLCGMKPLEVKQE